MASRDWPFFERKPPSIGSCSLYAWRKIFDRTGAPFEDGPISLNRSLAFEGNFRYTKSTLTLSTNARLYSSMQRTFSFSSIFRRKRYHWNRRSMILALFFCFVAGISSSLSFLSSLLLKFPILQHSGTGSCFVAEIPSCNVCLSSGTFARFWYSSLVNSVIFLFVSAISFFTANLTFHLINRSLYPITDLPLNYRFLISFSFYRCNSSKISLSLKFLARSFAILFALSLQILFYVKSIAFLLSRLAMQSYL